MKQTWPAPERNKEPILAVLKTVLPVRGTVLEIASGTGQHVVYFAQHLPALRFLPTDPDPANLASIHAWVAEANLPNIDAPRALDVRADDWGTGLVEAIFNANMIHIAPWEVAEGLMRGASRTLVPSGVLVMYGPFRIGGVHISKSNEEFDLSLRSRDPSWGVRDVDDVAALADSLGLSFVERIAMPSNNQSLVFRKR